MFVESWTSVFWSLFQTDICESFWNLLLGTHQNEAAEPKYSTEAGFKNRAAGFKMLDVKNVFQFAKEAFVIALALPGV